MQIFEQVSKRPEIKPPYWDAVRPPAAILFRLKRSADAGNFNRGNRSMNSGGEISPVADTSVATDGASSISNRTKPRIAILLFSLAGGGAERTMLQLAGTLAKRDILVDLILVRKQGAYLDQIPAGIRVLDLAASRTLTSFIPLSRYLRREHPDALLAALTPMNVVAVVTARLSWRRPRVAVCEQNQVSKKLDYTRPPLVRLAYRLIPIVYPLADAVIAVSHGVAADVAQRAGISPRCIEVIHNAIVSPDLYRLAGEKVEHRWLATGEPPVILGAGRLVPQKDFATLIRSFALLRKRRKARLIIMGDGVERAALERLARELDVREDIDFPGFLPNPYALMSRAGVFVLSSAWEGLPTVLVEAMACGAAVVSTDCPSGPAEILEGGRLGRLVPVGNAEALAAAILETMERPFDREAVRRRARDFAVEQSAERYAALLLGNRYPVRRTDVCVSDEATGPR